MKTMLRILMIMLVFAMIFAPQAVHAVDDAIIGIVNNEVITLKELRQYMLGIVKQLRLEGKSKAEIEEIMVEYEDKGIEKLIEDRLILSKANEVGIEVKPEFVKARLDDIKKEYTSEQAFLDALKAEGITVSDIRKKLDNKFKSQFIVEHEVKAKIYVNPQEVTRYYTENFDEFKKRARVHLDSIFVDFLKGKTAAREKIAQAQTLLDAGKDFNEVAEEFSDLPSVGVIEKGTMISKIEDAVFGLTVGTISEPIEVDNGIYIFKITGRVPGQVAKLKEVKDEIYAKLFEEKFKQEFREWVADLRERAYVEIK